MKKISISVIASILFTSNILAEEANCKTLKACSDWVTSRTGVIHVLGKLEKRSLKTEKDLNLSEGDADLIYSYILNQNDLARIKRENGTFEVIALRELKDYVFPMIKPEELKSNLDIYSMEFSFSDKVKVKNAMVVLKKFLSKNGKIFEATDGTKVIVTDTGAQLLMLKNFAYDLNK